MSAKLLKFTFLFLHISLFSFCVIFPTSNSTFQPNLPENSHTVDTGIVLSERTSDSGFKLRNEHTLSSTATLPINGVTNNAVSYIPEEITAKANKSQSFQASTLTALQAILAELKAINDNLMAITKPVYLSSNFVARSAKTSTLAAYPNTADDKLIFPVATKNSSYHECPTRFTNLLLSSLNAQRAKKENGSLLPLSYNTSLAREAHALAVKQVDLEDYSYSFEPEYLTKLGHYGQYAENLKLSSDLELDLQQLNFWSGRWSGRPWIFGSTYNKTEIHQMTEKEWQGATEVGFGCVTRPYVPGRYCLWVGALFKYV